MAQLGVSGQLLSVRYCFSLFQYEYSKTHSPILLRTATVHSSMPLYMSLCEHVYIFWVRAHILRGGTGVTGYVLFSFPSYCQTAKRLYQFIL